MSSSRYWELSVPVGPEVSEGLTNFAWELGALGVVEEEEPDKPSRLRAFFPKTELAAALEERVRAYLAGVRALGFETPGGPSVVALADEDWAEAWRAHFRPVAVGRSLLVAPPWERPPRTGRNPKTGSKVSVPAKYVPHFKAGKELKERVVHK